jgi:hypothetical protein
MAQRQIILGICVALTGLTATACNRKHLRNEPTKPIAQMPSPLAKEMAAQPRIDPPSPPLPPSIIQPPKADALTGIVPAIPKGGLPSEMPPAEIPDAAAPILPVSNDEAIGGPIREKLEELKKRAQERRQDKAPPKLPSPTEPKSPAPAPMAPSVPAPTTLPPATIPDSPKALPLDDLAAAKKLLDTALARYSEINDFEAYLVKAEVLDGKALPREESVYRFRKQPLSVYNKVLSDAGQGREMLYVRGQFGDKMHVLTGKGDNALVGAGFKTDLDPDSKTAASKSRWKVYEAGFSRNLSALSKAIGSADARHATVKFLGNVKRPEYPYELAGVEFSVRPGAELHLPKGGLRKIFFDTKADSTSFGLPVIVTTQDADGKEVEYYCFSKFKIPSGWSEADWNPSRLGKK